MGEKRPNTRGYRDIPCDARSPTLNLFDFVSLLSPGFVYALRHFLFAPRPQDGVTSQIE